MIIAIDPGGVHNGIATFGQGGENDGWSCSDAWEEHYDHITDVVAQRLMLGGVHALVVEQFTLYPDKAMQQTGSTMPTCEIIGQLKYVHRLAAAALAKEQRIVPALILQPAAIQQPTQAVLRNRKIKSEAKRRKAGPHALSAELHGWHYLLRTLGIKANEIDRT